LPRSFALSEPDSNIEKRGETAIAAESPKVLSYITFSMQPCEEVGYSKYSFGG
jgi:hypothetical protein